MSIEEEQQALCAQYDATFTPSPKWINSGVAIGTEAMRPIHGLRHPPTIDTTGWYIWCGELSQAPDFFKPVHSAHLNESLPEVLPFLGLPPGYRFLIAEGHRDVWFDETLLTV
jgi:hypothetical protein